MRLLWDPARRALARWGGALVDLGITEEGLAEGYGMSYARALSTSSRRRTGAGELVRSMRSCSERRVPAVRVDAAERREA